MGFAVFLVFLQTKIPNVSKMDDHREFDYKRTIDNNLENMNYNHHFLPMITGGQARCYL